MKGFLESRMQRRLARLRVRTLEARARSWQDVLWREMQTTEDDAWARTLFELLRGEPAPRGHAILIRTLAGLGGALAVSVLALAGLAAWGLGAAVAITLARRVGARSLTRDLTRGRTLALRAAVPPPGGLVVYTASLAALGIAIAAVAGGLGGLRAGAWALSAVGLTVVALLQDRYGEGRWRRATEDAFGYVRAGREQSAIARPFPHELLAALEGASRPELAGVRRRLRAATEDGGQLEDGDVTRRVEVLETGGAEERVDAAHALSALGGTAVPTLWERWRALSPTQQGQPVAPPGRLRLLWVLRAIAAETAERLAERAAFLVCTRCLSRCRSIEIGVVPTGGNQGEILRYWGCRTCGQSRSFTYVPGELTAVLDAGDSTERRQQRGAYEVNWSVRRALFDFDQVRIDEASESDIEAFAIQVGNDEDPERKRGYGTMRCRIAPDVEPTPNSLAILERTFGEVVQA